MTKKAGNTLLPFAIGLGIAGTGYWFFMRKPAPQKRPATPRMPGVFAAGQGMYDYASVTTGMSSTIPTPPPTEQAPATVNDAPVEGDSNVPSPYETITGDDTPPPRADDPTETNELPTRPGGVTESGARAPWTAFSEAAVDRIQFLTARRERFTGHTANPMLDRNLASDNVALPDFEGPRHGPSPSSFIPEGTVITQQDVQSPPRHGPLPQIIVKQPIEYKPSSGLATAGRK